jgi:hypothetical protein
MRKMIPALSVATLLAAISVAGSLPASAAGHYDKQDRYIQNFCNANPHANDCNDWRSNRGHWDNDRYQNFYRAHQSDHVFNSSVVANVFGVTLALNTGGPINTGPSHISACRAHFHSYNQRTDSYMGYDNRWHRCAY